MATRTMTAIRLAKATAGSGASVAVNRDKKLAESVIQTL